MRRVIRGSSEGHQRAISESAMAARGVARLEARVGLLGRVGTLEAQEELAQGLRRVPEAALVRRRGDDAAADVGARAVHERRELCGRVRGEHRRLAQPLGVALEVPGYRGRSWEIRGRSWELGGRSWELRGRSCEIV